MKYYLSLIALIFVSLIVTSGFSTTSSPLEIGQKAPDFAISNDTASFSLKEARGQEVLITFWSVKDAASRRDCNAYAALLSDSNIKHIAINLDQNSTLYNEILKRDELSGDGFFSPDAYTSSQIAQSYALDGHYGSVLISADGKILAFNPDLKR